MMDINPRHVYLISGRQFIWERGALAPEVEQCVVIAHDDRLAYGFLATSRPNFKPIGHATLFDYEQAASKIRATLNGENSGLEVVVATDMPGLQN